ncbi:DUF6896 domain-containing protein [Chishuiella changwenlii]|uniref:DUF6896 domain-containing protein n=1 Tax=Chishuiella changwenlii TaxID=1434701 RepID=UPI002FDACB5D
MGIKKYLEIYKSFIIEFEETIKQYYKINDNLYEGYIGVLFKREGSIKNYKYRFHGGGCEVIQNDIICDYDYIPYDRNFKYQYTICSLHTFIETYFNLKIDKKDLKKEIEEFVKKGEIKKLIEDGREYDVYFI